MTLPERFEDWDTLRVKLTLKTQCYRISAMNTDEIRNWSGLSYHETLIRQQYAEQMITISHVLDVLGLGSSELGWDEKWAETGSS